MKTSSPSRRKFTIPEDFANRTVLDAFADAFTAPEDLPVHRPDSGAMARVRDGLRIRDYFRKAMGAIDQELQHKQSGNSCADTRIDI